MHPFSRRQFLNLAAIVGGGLLAGGLLGCTVTQVPTGSAPATGEPQAAGPSPAPAGTVAPLERLVIQGPPSPPTILLAHLATQERLQALVPDVSFSTYKNPDHLRAGIMGGDLHVAAVPTYVAANLYRRGVPVQLLDVTVWGILHVLTVDDSIQGWSDLKGKTIAIPFKNDMPDLVFRYLAEKNGLQAEQDLRLQHTAAPVEALQMLLGGRAQAVVLPEPAATAAQVQGQAKQLTVRRVLDLQAEWATVTGRAARIPQAGTLIMAKVAREHPDVVQAIQAGLRDAVAWVKQDPAAAAELGAQHLDGLQAPIIQKSLAHTPLESVPAAEAQEDLEFFFSRLKELSPDIIGGDLPDAGLYYGAE